mmetsp:Transcript_10497/g.23616  ORF Transcript_10497/g.23616 Transcript_10497/m.23616 type:complete len:96 (+) Transcript_10497:137-424(+)
MTECVACMAGMAAGGSAPYIGVSAASCWSPPSGRRRGSFEMTVAYTAMFAATVSGLVAGAVVCTTGSFLGGVIAGVAVSVACGSSAAVEECKLRA